MSFASWYSIYRNLPDAKVALLCARDLKGGYASYNWPYRCDIRFFQHENVGKRVGLLHLNKLYATCVALKEGFLKQPLLIVDCDMMAVRGISSDLLERLNDPNLTFGMGGSVWYFKNQPIERLVASLNNFRNFIDNDTHDCVKLLSMLKSSMGEPEMLLDLCCDVCESEQAVFTHYCSGSRGNIGKFDKQEWIATRSVPPFGYVGDIVSSGLRTLNEQLVVKLWGQMKPVYESVC
jgi:hypothetical protein